MPSGRATARALSPKLKPREQCGPAMGPPKSRGVAGSGPIQTNLGGFHVWNRGVCRREGRDADYL
jgi:hypothetical protein